MAAYNPDFSSDSDEGSGMLNTPENLIVDTDLYNLFDPAYGEPSSSSNSIAAADKPVPLPIDHDEVRFVRDEWFVTDAHSGKQRPPRQQEFLRLLLDNPRYHSYATWLNKDDGLFTLLLPDQVARLWGQVKHRQTHKEMDYAKFSRGLRSYYDKGLMVPTYKRYTFCFAQLAPDRLV